MTNISDQLRATMKGIRKELTLAYEGELTNEDGEEVSLFDYLNEALDVDFRVDCQKEALGCRAWLCLGGPNIWIDTEDKSLHGAWGNERDSIPLDEDLCEQILDEYWYNI